MSIKEALEWIENFERNAQTIEERILEGDEEAEKEDENLDWAKYDAMQDMVSGAF